MEALDSNSNPFATRWTRPGALPYLFPPGLDGDQLLATLRSHCGWGQIVGPHGTGKTTLLCELELRLREVRTPLRRYQLKEGDADFPWRRELPTWSRGVQVIIDGFEQMPMLQRWLLQRLCRRLGCGLLVTTHRRLWGIPVLARTKGTVELALQIVERLLRDRPERVSPDEVRATVVECGGNLRETLFRLYDLAERRRTDP